MIPLDILIVVNGCMHVIKCSFLALSWDIYIVNDVGRNLRQVFCMCDFDFQIFNHYIFGRLIDRIVE